MQGSANNDVGVLIAPDRLISETRGEFRAAAIQQLDELHKDKSAGVLVIDLSQTVDIDASGLGMLVFIQKRAKEHGLSTVLRHAPERVRNLLKLTLLEFLFELRD